MWLGMQVRAQSVEDYKAALKEAGLLQWCESLHKLKDVDNCCVSPQYAWFLAKEFGHIYEWFGCSTGAHADDDLVLGMESSCSVCF